MAIFYARVVVVGKFESAELYADATAGAREKDEGAQVSTVYGSGRY